jgi:predicted amidohydrolase YtcJ
MNGTADTIFTNGDIITMSDATPSAQALAVKDGRILAVGSSSEVLKTQGSRTKRIDLGGKTLVPGFLDGHSHFINAIRMASWANLSAPPVGPVKNIADLIAALKEKKEELGLKPGEWLVGYGYDGTTLEDGREATRADLDPHFPDNPVVAMHVSLHGALLNTTAFKAVNIGLRAPTPAGGMTARIEGTDEAAGLVMEHSFLPVYMNMPSPTEQQQLDAFDVAQRTYAGNGYTTAQDAPMEPATRPLYHKAADQGRFFIDFVGFVNWLEFPELVEKNAEPFKAGYNKRFRIGGVKIVGDGSPQGKTAFWSKPLLTPGPGGEKDWRGEPNIAPEDLNKLVKLAYDNGIQVWTHCNGDATIDMMLDAHEAAGAPPNKRTTIIHSQFVRPDQLDKYVKYGFIASFFTNHAFFWGDVHVENLGKERAYFLSPTRSAKERGIPFSNHSDFAVTPLNAMFILWTSVSRTSRSGQVIGAGERITPHEGLRALTVDAAYQYGEEKEKGSLEAGKLADLVVLDRNPTKVPVDEIKDIQVVETFKEGTSVFSKDLGVC